jgi:hypothetical protein
MPMPTPSYTFTTMDAPGATETTPQAINDRGEVAGSYEDSYGFATTAAGSTASSMRTEPSPR